MAKEAQDCAPDGRRLEPAQPDGDCSFSSEAVYAPSSQTAAPARSGQPRSERRPLLVTNSRRGDLHSERP